jgi:hypothetical protein
MWGVVPSFRFCVSIATSQKKLGFGTSKMEKELLVGWNKMHVANDDMDVIFRFLSFF